MNTMPDSERLRRSITGAIGEDTGPLALSSLGGGDIHRALCARSNIGSWFVKWNRRDALPLFEAEALGLEHLACAPGPRVPAVVVCGQDGRHGWLVLEFLELMPSGDTVGLGTALAELHRVTAEAHGWFADNFIGHTPQVNDRCEDWAEFWWRQRLQPQLTMAEAAGYGTLDGAGALENASRRLLGHAPAPSLLHGDLWAGNHGYLDDGRPVIFDPACWYGDRETDLAMMRLFGGFDPRVFRAYETAWPLPDGHEDRLPLYQLYHVLNHLNLFGSAWLGRAEELLRRVLSRARHP